MRDAVLFDLDGTLTDPGEGITNSVAYALESFGIAAEDKTSLYPFIGPPLAESFAQFYGFGPEQVQQAVAQYREYFSRKGMYENVPYPGIHQALEELKQAGVRLSIATSKPLEFALPILRRFDLAHYFEHIGAADLAGRRSQKGQVIAYVLDQAGISDKSRAIMAGDRRYDALGARENGVDCAGVLYGYGSRQELLEAGVAALIESPDQLVRLPAL